MMPITYILHHFLSPISVLDIRFAGFCIYFILLIPQGKRLIFLWSLLKHQLRCPLIPILLCFFGSLTDAARCGDFPHRALLEFLCTFTGGVILNHKAVLSSSSNLRLWLRLIMIAVRVKSTPACAHRFLLICQDLMRCSYDFGRGSYSRLSWWIIRDLLSVRWYFLRRLVKKQFFICIGACSRCYHSWYAKHTTTIICLGRASE